MLTYRFSNTLWQVRCQLHHTSIYLQKLIQILGGCKRNRNLVYFFKYSLALCCQNSSLPSLSPYLPRLPRCSCYQTLCGRCCPCPYFPPWPLLPSSRPFLGLHLVHCASSVWFLLLSLSFGFLALILPLMILTRTSQEADLHQPRRRLSTLFNHPRRRIAPLSFPKSSSALHRGISGQSKHDWHQGWPSCFISPPLPHRAPALAKPCLGHTLPSAANSPPAG